MDPMRDAGHSYGEEDAMNTRMTAELHTALGSAFSATLLGVAVSEELRKRGVAVYRQAEDLAAGDGGL